MTDILAGIGQGISGIGGLLGANQIPQRQIGIQIKLAQNTQTNQPTTFSGLGSSGGGLGSLLSGGISGLTGGLISGSIGGNQVNITGLRASVHIRNAGALPTCDLRVWGLPPNVLNQMNSLGLKLNIIAGNLLTITAGDNINGMAPVFDGVIMQAYADYENQPDVPLIIIGSLGGLVLGSTPTTYPQGFSIVEAMTTLAQKMGLTLNNAGNVNVQLPPMYVSGSPMVQIRKLARAAGISFGISPTGALELFQKGQARTDTGTIIVSKATGMIASPSFTQSGVIVKTLFNPQIRQYSTMTIQSNVLQSIAGFGATAVSNQYMINQIDLDLEAQVPKGQWQMTLQGYPSGTNVTIPSAT